MKPKLNKFMSFTPENLEMIGTKIQKTYKKRRLMEFKRNAFQKLRNRNKFEPENAQLAGNCNFFGENAKNVVKSSGNEGVFVGKRKNREYIPPRSVSKVCKPTEDSDSLELSSAKTSQLIDDDNVYELSTLEFDAAETLSQLKNTFEDDDEDDIPELHYNILSGNSAAALDLINKEGVDLEEKVNFDGLGYLSGIHVITRHSQVLLETEDKKYSPLYLALYAKEEDVFLKLWRTGVPLDSLGLETNALIKVLAVQGFNKSIKAIARVDSQLRINMFDINGLRAAIFASNEELVKLILRNKTLHNILIGFPLSHMDPRMHALRYCEFEIFDLLISEYGDTEQAEFYKKCHLQKMLHFAVSSDLYSIDVVRFLLQRGVNPNINYSDAAIPRSCSFHFRTFENLALLVKYGLNCAYPSFKYGDYYINPIRFFLEKYKRNSDTPGFDEAAKYMTKRPLYHSITIPTSASYSGKYMKKVSSILTSYLGYFDFTYERFRISKVAKDEIVKIKEKAESNRERFKEFVKPILEAKNTSDIPVKKYTVENLKYFVESLNDFISNPENTGNPWKYCGIAQSQARVLASIVELHIKDEFFAYSGVLKERQAHHEREGNMEFRNLSKLSASIIGNMLGGLVEVAEMKRQQLVADNIAKERT